ncbi:MAG: hypothetical protein IJ519_02395, partial [Clostridia bacterium]|nr:hypothetical protein [Clostridia bacterium]
MAFSKECYRTVRAAFDAKREKAEYIANTKRRKLYRENPELETIDLALSRTAMRIMTEVRRGKDGLEERLNAVRESNEQLHTARRAILTGMGYAPDEDSEKYECEICEDKGYVEERMCACFRSALVFEGLSSSGLGTLLKTQSFDTFSLDYYTGQDRVEAERNLRACRKYAEEFSLDSSPNLTFIGGTGLGKTHMSTSIAR